MLRIFATTLSLLMALSFSAGAVSLDDFTPGIADLNVTAQADLPGFKGTLSTTFGIPVPRVDVLIATFGSPADAYFCLRLNQLSGRSIEEITHTYRAHRGQGWGVIARELGIKPGSQAFHALKDTSDIKQKHQAQKKSKGNAKDAKGKGNKK